MEYQLATLDQYEWMPRCSCLSQIKFQQIFKLEQTCLPVEPFSPLFFCLFLVGEDVI